MEETMRRTVPRRYASNQRRKSKPIYNYRILRKVLVQLIVSCLILICILGIRNMNTPLTNIISTKINDFLKVNLDLNWAYQSVNGVITKAANLGKSILQPSNKLEPSTQDAKPDENGINTPANSDGASAQSAKEAGGTEGEAKKVNTIVSSLNTSEVDAKAIKNDFTIALPVKGPVSSPFGLRINPITKKQEFHPGIDIKANQGTPIYAAIAGTVIEARRGTTFGNFIRINSGKHVVAVYAHCHRLNVKSGQKVVLGQKIGEVGNTGMSQGAHLHFEVWKNEIPVDPAQLFTQYKK